MESYHKYTKDVPFIRQKNVHKKQMDDMVYNLCGPFYLLLVQRLEKNYENYKKSSK